MQFWSLRTGNSSYTPYEKVRELQLKLVDQRAQDQIPDTVLFLEHEPVVTRGRGLQFTGEVKPRHMPMQPLPPEVAFAESERGGDLTYHGPGQLVIYPICKLDGKGIAPDHDVAAFLRKMEAILIAELNERFAPVGAQCEGVENATGVWVRAKGEAKAEKKIASMGIAVRKWVSYHGLALNCVNELRPFQLISPCGFAPEVMTRVQDWVPLEIRAWRGDLEQSLARRMEPGARLESLILNSLTAG
jgi:lipoate-protein ligase B